METMDTSKMNERVNNPLRPYDISKPDVPDNFLYEFRGRGFARRGNLGAISGWTGQGRTSITTLLIAAAITGECDGIKCLNKATPERPILYIDTGQSQPSVGEWVEVILDKAGYNAYRDTGVLKVYSSRDCDQIETPEELNECVLELIKMHNPSYVIIDELLDLITHFDDPKACEALFREYMRIAAERDLFIWEVVYEEVWENEDTIGYFEGLLYRKLEVRIHVEKDENDPNDNDIKAEFVKNRGLIPDGFEVKYHLSKSTPGLYVPCIVQERS